MAASTPPNKKKRSREQFLREADTRNRAGLGWQVSDFGLNPLPTTTFGAAPGQMVSAANSRLGLTNQLSVNTPATAVLTPEEIKRVQTYIKNPAELGVVTNQNGPTTFLMNLFNTDDNKETWVESAWDGALKALDWPTQQINHASSWIKSAMPGGLDTFTWDQAQQVSAGQAQVLDTAVRAGRFQRGEQTVGDIVGRGIGVLQLNPGEIAGLTGTMPTQIQPLMQPGLDVTSPDVQKMFQEDTTLKILSGSVDFGISFIDPYFGAGKLAKLSRLKYLDRVFTSPAQHAALKAELATAYTAPKIEDAAPVAQFAEWTTRVDAKTGEKVASWESIYNHKTVRASDNREGLTDALFNTRDVTVTDIADPTKTTTIKAYDLAALIIRWGSGDVSAARELAAVRADMADALAMAERNRLGLMHALNPGVRDHTVKIAERAMTKADDEIKRLEDLGYRGTPEWDSAVKAKGIAQDTMLDIKNGNFDLLQAATPDGEAAAQAVWKSLLQNDDALRAALGADVQQFGGVRQTLIGSTKGFARNNRVGRAVERRRQKVAQIEYENASVRGAMYATGKQITRVGQNLDGTTAEQMKRSYNPWRRDVFGNGFTRTTNLWRRASQEAPSGFMIVRGPGAAGSGREMRAQLNGLRMYSGAARKVTLADGSVIEVGGLKRKQQLLEHYNQAVAESVHGGDSAAIALRQVEEWIMGDLSAWYGIHRNNAKALAEEAFRKRGKLMENLTSENRAFWVDDKGEFNVIKDPWLDSHMTSGVFMHNYREFERLAARYEKTGIGRILSDGSAFVGQNLSTLFGWFNDFWRPAVLLRLGYTIRNNIEGNFRAAAFTGGLDPFGAAMVNVGYTARRMADKVLGRASMDQAKAQELIDAAKAGGRSLPKKFEPWLHDQVAGISDEINGFQAHIGSQLERIAVFSPEVRAWGMQWFDKTRRSLMFDLAAAKQAGNAGEVQRLTDFLNVIQKQHDSIRTITQFQAYTGDAVRAFRDIQLNELYLEKAYKTLESLGDEATALSVFFSQGTAKARAFTGTIPGPNGEVLLEAFNPKNEFAPMALSLLSSDGTYRSLLSSRTEGISSALRAQTRTYYAPVKPGDRTYWESLATMLTQVRASAIGERIMLGQSDDVIADFLLHTDEGRSILTFLKNQAPPTSEFAKTTPQMMRPKAVTRQTPHVRFDRNDAIDVVRQARERYETLAPTPEFRGYVESVPAGMELNAKSLEKAFTGPQDQLATVVGTQIHDFAPKNLMQMWRDTTAWTMKWLGTIPEDTFTRSPFYGARHRSVLQTLVNQMRQQSGPVTMADINQAQRIAHRRALKDTKDWLYTIERPTLLGSVGETTIPFISAAQNSITTVGKLIWNDPSVAAALVALWRAPTKAGLEDEQGNIVIPIPHDMIPDAVEKALGLDVMTNWKIKKNQLNVIVPESGFGFIPRPGPLVAVPVSELMKRGWLGQQVESPEILRTILGGKENADAVWNVYKNYIFGEGQGVAPDPMSLSMFLPPTAAKIVQILQGENSTQFGYWYNLIYRSEMVKWAGGQRQDRPTKDEVMKQAVGFQLLRLAANLTAITPPTYESMIDPMVNTVRYYQRTAPNDSNRIINEKFGPILQMFGDFSNSRNNAGMLPTVNSVEAARKYSDIIAAAAPGLEQRGDLSVLSMLTMGNANQLYDDSAYGWQFANTIPGLNMSFREMQTPSQAWVQSDVNAGWSTYLRADDQFKARLRQSGKTSFRSVPELDAERKQYIYNLGQNPLFENWYRDYKENGSSRTLSSIYLMETLVTNPQFMQDQKDNQIWQLAPIYLQHRNVVLNALAQRQNHSITGKGNEDIQQYWDDVRFGLESNMQWSAFASRFLNGDDKPDAPGVSFGMEGMVQ